MSTPMEAPNVGAVPPQQPQIDSNQAGIDVANRITLILQNKYEVQILGPNHYKAERGTLGMNILCGALAQYYAYDIQVFPDRVAVESTVPCNGCWGGLIGVSMNNKETSNVQMMLQNARATNQIYDVNALATQTTVMHSTPPAMTTPPMPPQQQATPQDVAKSSPAAVAPAPMEMSRSEAQVKVVTQMNEDGSKIVTKETTNPDGSKTVQVTNYPAEGKPNEVPA